MSQSASSNSSSFAGATWHLVRCVPTPALKPKRAASPRFFRFSPLAARIIFHPVLAGIALFVPAVVTAPFSIHYALGFVIIWLATLAYYLERRFLECNLLPPFAMIMLWEALGLGLGVPLLVLGGARELFSRELLIMQFAFIAIFPIAYAGYRLGFGASRGMEMASASDPSARKEIYRPLAFVGWMLLVWRIVQITVLAATGADDRGDYGIVAQGESWGVFTYFLLFPRFTYLGFVLLPLIIRESRTFISRFAVFAACIYYFSVALATGARGNLFYPIIYLGVGYYMFSHRIRRHFDVAALVMFIAALPLIVLINSYRNTEAYRETRSINIISRIKAIGDAKLFSSDDDNSVAPSSVSILGAALMGVSDEMIYEKTPSAIPHAGFANFSAILYTWVPAYIMPEKPLIWDANQIVNSYRNQESHTGSAISLTADLFRRFGWPGVAIGTFLGWWVYGRASRVLYFIYSKLDAFFGAVLIVFSSSFFLFRPFGTVLSTWWIWAYDLPKHLVVLTAMCCIVRLMNGGSAARGAVAYSENH